jgi:hypothetical protein
VRSKEVESFFEENANLYKKIEYIVNTSENFLKSLVSSFITKEAVFEFESVHKFLYIEAFVSQSVDLMSHRTMTCIADHFELEMREARGT